MRIFILSLLMWGFSFPLGAQELLVSYANATTAVNTLVGSNGITVSNATYNGATSGSTNLQLGLASNPSGLLGFTSGIILSTGNALFAQQINTTNVGDHLPVNSSAAPDPDLQLLLGGAQRSPAVLEFDFTTTGARPSFDFVFLSEEYNNYAPSNFHDGFGFFISGPGISGPFSNGAVNIAVLSTGAPISVNTVNACTNTNYYRNNCRQLIGTNCIAQQAGPSTCPAPASSLNNMQLPYNALTAVLQATITLNCALLPGATYHCKLAIANISDQNYDSAVIFKAGSLNSDLYISPITLAPQPVCAGQPLSLSVNGSPAYTYAWSPGPTGTGLTSITVAAALADNPYSVTATNSDGCTIVRSANAVIHTPANVAPTVNGINNTGNYIFYAQAGVSSCFTVPTFDTPGENVAFSSSVANLPPGSSFISNLTGQEIGTFCWTPPSGAIGVYTFTVNFSDNNACGPLSGSATFTVRVGCGSCVPVKYYENRQPSANPLPAFTKAGFGIYAGQSVDPAQTDGPVDVGTATVTFKAGVTVVLDPGFITGPGFTALIDPSTCITDCEDCCTYFPGLTYDFIPNVFTPNGDGQNEIWFIPDKQYPFCAYNAQYFKLEIFNPWGNLVFDREIASATCCPFRSNSSNADPTIPSIHWDGVANHSIDYNWWDELLGKKDAQSGNLVAAGTYYFILTLSGCGAAQSFNGFITLIR